MRRNQRGGESPQMNVQLARQLKDLPPLHVAIYKGAGHFVKAFPITSFLWIFGLSLMFFCSGLAVSEEANEQYAALLEASQSETEALEKAEMKAARYNQVYQQSRGFMGFSCDSSCQHKYEQFQAADRERQIAKEAHYKALSEAKSKVGVFSIYAVQEARDLFWGTFAQGKGFAKRASTWDLIFMGIGSMGRDEGMLSFVLRFAMNVLINFTMGLIGALVAFIWQIWGVIRSYQPDPVTAIISFILFSIASTAMVAATLFALYGTAASGVYLIARTAAQNMRIEGPEGESREGPGQIGTGGSSDPTSPYANGRRVRLQGLINSAEYNGRTATIMMQDGDRYHVQLSDGRVLKVRASNMATHID